MPRPVPPGRFVELVEAATRVFLAHGYRRAQMADVAEELGVAKGTVYLYVESKEALFDLVLRQATEAPRSAPARLPVPTPKPGATLRYVRDRLSREPLLGELEEIVARRPGRELRAELELVLGRIYDRLSANRLGIKLVDRCAPDHPDLGNLWFREGRESLLDSLHRYLVSRLRSNALVRRGDLAVVARILLETLVFWAVHRHWDPSPQVVEEATARETVIRFLGAAILPVENAQ